MSPTGSEGIVGCLSAQRGRWGTIAEKSPKGAPDAQVKLTFPDLFVLNGRALKREATGFFHIAQFLEDAYKPGDFRVAEAQKVQVLRRTMPVLHPEFEEHGAFQDKAVGAAGTPQGI